MTISNYLIFALLTAGFSLCLSFLSFFIGTKTKDQKKWMLLSIMGLFEAFYCYGFYRYMSAPNWHRSFFWAGLFCIVMPHMTALYAYLTIHLLKPKNSFLNIMPKATLLLASIFSILMASDLFLETHFVFKELLIFPDTLRQKQMTFNYFGQAWLGLVNIVFYICAYQLIKGYRKGHHEILPIIIGTIFYFIAVSSDFNVLFGIYDFHYIQHFGFIAMVVGFLVYFTQDYIKSVKNLEEAYQEIQVYQEELLHGEKLKLIGTMSAFLVHEIRNPLTVIKGYIEMLLSKVPESSKEAIVPLATRIDKNTNLISEILATFNSFSKKGDKVALKEETLGEIYEEALIIAKFRNVDKLLPIETNFDKDIKFPCNSAHLTQCFVNLINNSCDALETVKNAWIKVEASNVGNILTIKFIDSGTPPKDLAKKIDKPFQTTTEKGTGLGLGVLKMLVEKQNGRFFLDQNYPTTCFVIELQQA